MEKNQIIIGDCVQGMSALPAESVDLILTDPPYNTGMTKSNGGWLNNFFDDNYQPLEYEHLAKESCTEMFRVLKNNKAAYVFMGWKQVGLWMKSLQEAGFLVKNLIVWDKMTHGLNYQNYAYQHEFLIFAVKGNFHPKVNKREHFTDVWRIQRKVDTQKDSVHETVKPFKVLQTIIEQGSGEDDLVLDPFMGSGSTALACKKLGRSFYGFETNQEYVDHALEELRRVPGRLERFF